MKNLLLFIVTALIFTSCASTDKLLERGDYDKLIFLTTKKLSGKKKKDIYVQALEKGFDKITRRDMARIEELRQSDSPEDWEDIVNIANEIQHRQDRIEPFLPLVSESGYQAKFNFVKTNKIITEAKATSVSLYQQKLDELVNAARKGNKNSARDAYDLIGHLHHLSNDVYQPALRDEMWDLGINKIFVRIENNSGAILPAYYEEELIAVDFENYDRSWDRFYTDINEDTKVDYEVILRIQDVIVSPEGLKEHQHLFTREVKDGWEYVLDAKGNVAKDSLGNDIKRDKFTRVSATVVETLQSKSALVRARMEVVKHNTGLRVYSQPLEVENVFNHTARKFFGDERALDNNQKAYVEPIPYPSDLIMIMDAFKAMKPKFFNEAKRYNYMEG